VEPTVVRTEVGDDVVRAEGVCTGPSVLSNLEITVGEAETDAPNKLFRLVALAGATNVKLLDKMAKRLDASSLSTASVVYVVVE
jgi:hypothetical protein